MRASEFLTELNMSPSALTAFLNGPVAAQMMAGFEAELVYTKLEGGTEPDDEDDELDYDRDENISKHIDSDDIDNFFSLGRREIDPLWRDYEEYTENEYADWSNDNYSDYRTRVEGDYPEENELASEGDAAADEFLSDKAHDLMRDEWDDNKPSLYRFLSHEGMFTMLNIAERYGYAWPFFKSKSSWGDAAAELADTVSNVTGMQAQVSTSYHETTKRPGIWYIEPDGSIDTDITAGATFGAELVSPPMPVAEMLQKMEAVLNTLRQRFGAVSNQSTGFHVGVSMPGITSSNLDYVKLALFLGDEYVLQQFGRAANTYTASALRDLRDWRTLEDEPERKKMVLSKLRAGLMHNASQEIAIRNNTRTMSINVKANYVEFRSMGGDYLQNLPLVKATILRYLQAYAVAADPNANRQEYAKKLAKLLGSNGNDDLSPFINYMARLKDIAAGTVVGSPAHAKTVLKSTLKNIQGKDPRAPRIARSPAPKLPPDKLTQQ